MISGRPNWDDFPVTVELRFRTAEERDRLMAQLTDGFGENFCWLDWPRRDGATFDAQPRFAVTLYDEPDDDDDDDVE